MKQLEESEEAIKTVFEDKICNQWFLSNVRDLLTYYDAEQTAFSIINLYGLLTKNQTSEKMTGNSMTAGLGLAITDSLALTKRCITLDRDCVVIGITKF